MRNEFSIDTSKRKLQVKSIHNFLTDSYWAKGIPIEAVKKQIENSLCFGVYHAKKQIGYARVITDYVSFAYLCDVYVLEGYRGKGLSKWMMEVIVDHPKLKKIKAWLLATKDAHGLYEKFGFKQLPEPGRYMKRVYFENWDDR